MNLKISQFLSQISEKLPHAMIIYTSRPVAVSHLLRLINKCKRIEIIGFKREQVQKYIETTLDHLNKVEDTVKNNLMKQINSNTFVERLVYIPIYLTIIIYLFDTLKSLPSTRTKLFYLLVQNIVLRHLIEKTHFESTYLMSLDDLPPKESEHFSNICHLAFQGLKNNEIIFNTTGHLHDYGIPEDINGLGLLRIAPTLCDHGKIRSLNFMHLNFQEFCAAFYISKLTEYEQDKIFMQHKDNPKFQICWQFFAGLTKLKYQQILNSMIPKSDLHSSLCKYDLIQLLLCLYETESPNLCKRVIKFMNGNIDLSEYDMDQLSCSALSYFIQNCAPGSIKTLKLKWCGIGDIGLQCICEGLMSNYKSHVESVDVRSHSVSLDFSYNEITEQGAHHIAELLSSPCVIECLNCTGNYQLGDNGVETIANSLLNNSIKILELGKTGFGLEGMQALSKVLCSDSNLNTLDISNNNLDFRMLNCLSESLTSNNTLTTLLLKWCKLGADEARVLSNIIKSNRTLNCLDLGYNKLGAGEITSIVSAVKENQSMQTLNLNVNGITCDDACYVADLISANLHHLSSLHIGGNFGKEGLATICKVAKKNTSLTTLDLTPNSMSVAESPLGCLVNVFNNIHIKSLHIVPPHDCSVLSEAIASNTTLEELKLGVKVTCGFTTLTEAIARNRTITKSEFLFTKLEKQWLEAISNILQVKTNFVSLIINGEVYPEDCMQLCNTLPKFSSLQFFSFTAYQKMIPATALQFLSCLYALNSLERITLKINSHLTQYETIPDQESSGAAQQKLIPKQNVSIFRQIECLISSINERRCSIGSLELRLFIQEN